MIPSTSDCTISLLTIINGTLIQYIAKKDIADIENLGTLFSVKNTAFNDICHT